MLSYFMRDSDLWPVGGITKTPTFKKKWFTCHENIG